jgi:hypothetical protein
MRGELIELREMLRLAKLRDLRMAAGLHAPPSRRKGVPNGQ